MSTGDQVKTEKGSSDQISMEASEPLINEVVRVLAEDGGSDEGLKKAFKVLSKHQNNARVSKDFLFSVLHKHGMEVGKEEVEEVIREVKPEIVKKEGEINCDEFIKIFKLLKEPTVVDQLKKIYGILVTSEEESKIVLYGDSGVGKTWMARKIADRAVRKDKFFDFAIWIYLNRIYEGLSLQESIAYQLSLLWASDELEANEDDKAKQEKIETTIHAKMKDKRLLLILDDEGSKMKMHAQSEENKLRLLSNDKGSKMVNLYQLLALDQLKSKKILITTRSRNEPTSGEIGIMVMPLTRDESKSLVLQKMVGVGDEKMGGMKDLVDFFVGKSKKLPSEVLVIAKTLSYFGESVRGLQKLRRDKEILLNEEIERVGKAHENKKFCNVIELLMSGYELIPKSVMIDCYSPETPERHFLHERAMADFNELISYWIIEGKLGNFDSIEESYKEGHRVLMDLVNCGLLKKLEASFVMSNGAKFDSHVLDRYESSRSMHLGLATTFDMKLGAIVLADGMIRTIKGKKKVLTLLIDGNHIGDEVSVDFLKSESDLEILAIFDPTHKHFPLPIFNMKKLRLLVLRGCRFLHTFEENFQLSGSPNPSQVLVPPSVLLLKLTAFELSGPSSLKTIPDNLFETMPNLRNLNMSFLLIEFLPQSLYNLTKLEFLILRGCSSLREIGSLKKSTELQVLDISGATSVKNIQDKSFSENKKLRILNLSKTKIERLPLIHSLENLESLSLTDCASLLRTRKVYPLKRLQILDISGAAKVEEFLDPSLENLESLVVLDVSGTSIKQLPSNISNPKYLNLRCCPKLKLLPPIEGLSKLEVLDLSGSSNLEEIKTEFFKNLKFLRELNVSKTGVKSLHFIPCLGSLCRLLLSECLSLEKLENLSSLQELEVLDLSGCKALVELEDNSFDKMNRLHTLILCGLHLDRIPSLSGLENLKQLYVRDCPRLSKLSGLEELAVLEILDHSGTTLKSKPSFPHCNPVSLGPISLSTENIDPLKLLKVLCASNVEFPSDKYESNAENSNLPQEDLDKCNWSISNWQKEANANEVTSGDPVNGIYFLQLLKMYPSLLMNNFSRFHFLVHPTEAQSEIPDKLSYRTELGLRKISLEQVYQQKLDRRLEIRGFNDFPPFLGHVLKQAEIVVLIDNPFLRLLPDLVSDSIKACWIERCNELEHVIGFEGAKSQGNIQNVEMLWISDVTKMRRIFSGEIQSISFKSLKCLYLEFCPELTMICSKSLQLESLETLHIRYCEKLKTPFKDDDGDDDSAKLEKLTALHLWGLPELEKISFKVPSLIKLRVGDCPMLRHVFSANRGDGSEVEGHEKLEILHVKFCDKLKTICQSRQEVFLCDRFNAIFFQTKLEEASASWLSELQQLEICDKLKAVFQSQQQHEDVLPSSPLPELRKLEMWDKLKTVFQIQSQKELELCEKLRTIFQSWKESKEDKDWLPELQKLAMWDKFKTGFKPEEEVQFCDKLAAIFQSQKNTDVSACLLELQKLELWKKVKKEISKPEHEIELCEKLRTIFQSWKESKEDKRWLPELQKLAMWDKFKTGFKPEEEVQFCDKLAAIFQSQKNKDVSACLLELQKLELWKKVKEEILQPEQELELCDKLNIIFQSNQDEDEHSWFPKLREVELCGLPELQRIACTAPSVHSLKVGECPLLQSLVDVSDKVHENLEVLEVKSCDKMKTIVQSLPEVTSSPVLQRVNKMELLCLPEMKSIGAELSSLKEENCTIWGCPKLEKPHLGEANMDGS